MSEGERFISGIFNYCDRWCERCPQTARCRLFAMNQEAERDSPALRDPANATFWEALGKTFAKTAQMLRDFADAANHDAIGSAKVALVGVERSLAAWSLIRDAKGDDEDAVLDLLVQLDRLHRAVDSALPAARTFVRPGFDEPGNSEDTIHNSAGD